MNKAKQMNTLLLDFKITNSAALEFLTHPINSRIFSLSIERDDDLSQTIIKFPDNSEIIFSGEARGVN